MSTENPSAKMGFLNLPGGISSNAPQNSVFLSANTLPELRNKVYALMENHDWHSQTPPHELKLRHCGSVLHSLDEAVRGPISFGQTCRKVRAEWLPILTRRINIVWMERTMRSSFSG